MRSPAIGLTAPTPRIVAAHTLLKRLPKSMTYGSNSLACILLPHLAMTRKRQRDRQDDGPCIEIELSLPSKVAAISHFVDKLMLLIKKSQCARGHEMDIEIALREALANAAVHGNHEDPRKHVHVRCRCKADEDVSIVVRDEGQGFDPNAVPDPTSSQAIESSHGRGIFLMKSLMDEVRFDHGGAVVYMRKKSSSTGSTRPEELG
jgi:serine/threonine-protein kinase RsbW